MDNRYAIVLADDHALIRRGIKGLIEKNQELKVVGEVGDGLELIDYLKTHTPPPDMVIMDLSMPNLGGIKATEKVKKQWPKIKVLILTMHKDKNYLNLSQTAGAEGYLLKHEADTELFAAISTIRQGGIYICPKMR